MQVNTKLSERVITWFNVFAENNLDIIEKEYGIIQRWVNQSPWIVQNMVPNIMFQWFVYIVDKYTEHKLIDKRIPPYTPLSLIKYFKARDETSWLIGKCLVCNSDVKQLSGWYEDYHIYCTNEKCQHYNGVETHDQYSLEDFGWLDWCYMDKKKRIPEIQNIQLSTIEIPKSDVKLKEQWNPELSDEMLVVQSPEDMWKLSDQQTITMSYILMNGLRHAVPKEFLGMSDQYWTRFDQYWEKHYQQVETE